MRQINVGVIGTGWCGGIRAVTCANYPLVDELHIAEIKPERLAEVKAETNAVFATADYQEILKNDDIDCVLFLRRPNPCISRWPRIASAPANMCFWKSRCR